MNNNRKNYLINNYQELNNFMLLKFGGENKDIIQIFNISSMLFDVLKNIENVTRLDEDALKYKNVNGIAYFIRSDE